MLQQHRWHIYRVAECPNNISLKDLHFGVEYAQSSQWFEANEEPLLHTRA